MKKIAFCVPTTTNKREWENAEETDLWRVLLTGLENHTPEHSDITIFIGFDHDCKVWKDAEQRMKCNATFTKFKIEWTAFGDEVKGKPTWIWNELAGFAISEGFEYLQILGDDIRLPRDTGWLSCFVNKLKKNRNIGWVAGWSNNDQIPTQFLIHKTHIDIFGWVYPPQIVAWYCDNHMAELYPKKFSVWLKSFPLLNVGGSPRYEPQDDTNLYKMLLKRHRPILNRFLQQMDK